MPQDLRKWLLIGYAFAVIIAVIYVPWTHRGSVPFPNGMEVPYYRREYSLVFASPFSGAGTIDFLAVLLEIVAITAAAGVAYLIWAFGKKDKP